MSCFLMLPNALVRFRDDPGPKIEGPDPLFCQATKILTNLMALILTIATKTPCRLAAETKSTCKTRLVGALLRNMADANAIRDQGFTAMEYGNC